MIPEIRRHTDAKGKVVTVFTLGRYSVAYTVRFRNLEAALRHIAGIAGSCDTHPGLPTDSTDTVVYRHK